jgi:hypothetical protein
MNPIEGKLYSPFQKEKWNSFVKMTPDTERGFDFGHTVETVWERLDATVTKIRTGNGFLIKNFRELIEEVAIVTISNKSYEMFYRGQSNDYKNSQSIFYKDKKPKTIIYPAICRPEKNEDGSYKHSLRKTQLTKRYNELYNMVDSVAGKRSYLPEYHFALLQHYHICPTPLIDITQSLRVAATFALRDSTTGYVYVFGLPYPNQSISHYTDMGIVLVKLQNVCPVEALRPRYQEGYLVGKYPFYPAKEGADNLARRLVAKFYLDNNTGTFWDSDFQPIPEDVLFPKNDKIELELKRAKNAFFAKYHS